MKSCTRRSFALALLLCAGTAHASMFAGEALDKVADVIAIIVLIVVPPLLIVIFWLVHILPEKIAEEREHPQKEAIKTLCLLSLVFGGLLWPLAWLLAYTKPVLHRMAYGRDKHDDYYEHLAESDAGEAGILSEDIARLRGEIDLLAARGELPEELQQMRERLIDLEERLVVPDAREGAS